MINKYRIMEQLRRSKLYISISLLDFLFSVDAIEVGSDISNDGILIGPKFVKTPSPFIRFSNSTGGTLHCAAKGNPSPVRCYHKILSFM